MPNTGDQHRTPGAARITAYGRWLAERVWNDVRPYAGHAAVVFMACVGVWLLKKNYFLVGDDLPKHPLMLFGVLAILAPVRSRDVAKPLLITHRVIFILFAFYALAAYPAVSDAYWKNDPYAAFLHLHARWVALAAAILAWFRPGFGLAPVALMAWKKHLMADQFGFPLNATDYYPVAELAMFTTLVIGVAAAAGLAEKRLSVPSGWRSAKNWSFGDAGFLGAFAIHMANYFYSAIAKITLPGAGLLTWVLENQTHYIMLATWSIGLGPLQGTGPLAVAAHEIMARFSVVTNAITFIAQLAGLICILRIRWAMVLTFFYDILHAVIFLTTSILFWKWMTLNVGLVLALKSLRARKAPPWPLSVMTIGVLLLSPLVFRVAWLGWFDTAALNRASVEAELADGRRVATPSTYFLEGSAQLAKSSIGYPFDGHFEDIGVFGKAERGRAQMHKANECGLDVARKSGLAQSFEREPKLEAYFKRHHDYIQSRANDEGRVNTWLFPHHNWPNPSLYKDFSGIDVRTIVSYHYIIESLCLSYDGEGGVDERIMLRGSYEIPVQ